MLNIPSAHEIQLPVRQGLFKECWCVSGGSSFVGFKQLLIRMAISGAAISPRDALRSNTKSFFMPSIKGK